MRALRLRMSWLAGLAALVLLAGCATRPINPPVTDASLDKGYTFQTRQKHFKSQDNLVVLAFSGGGTRAAAFSYGVLEYPPAHRGRWAERPDRFACSTPSA